MIAQACTQVNARELTEYRRMDIAALDAGSLRTFPISAAPCEVADTEVIQSAKLVQRLHASALRVSED